MPRLGVLGWPVAHSRSPAMFQAGFEASALDSWSYQLLPVSPELFAETVEALPQQGFVGANVTIPHKEAALAIAHDVARQADAIGAANMLTFSPDGVISAHNTDAPGLLAALPDGHRGASALVLGAGGSARAAVAALLEGGADEVCVWNRTPERALALVADLGGRVVRELGAAVLAELDVLVNCTSVGLNPSDSTFDLLPITPADVERFGCVVDLVYGKQTSELVAAAERAGVDTVDGLELLVAQGALAFTAWTGVAAPLDAMRAGARGQA